MFPLITLTHLMFFFSGVFLDQVTATESLILISSDNSNPSFMSHFHRVISSDKLIKITNQFGGINLVHQATPANSRMFSTSSKHAMFSVPKYSWDL